MSDPEKNLKKRDHNQDGSFPIIRVGNSFEVITDPTLALFHAIAMRLPDSVQTFLDKVLTPKSRVPDNLGALLGAGEYQKITEILAEWSEVNSREYLSLLEGLVMTSATQAGQVQKRADRAVRDWQHMKLNESRAAYLEHEANRLTTLAEGVTKAHQVFQDEWNRRKSLKD